MLERFRILQPNKSIISREVRHPFPSFVFSTSPVPIGDRKEPEAGFSIRGSREARSFRSEKRREFRRCTREKANIGQISIRAATLFYKTYTSFDERRASTRGCLSASSRPLSAVLEQRNEVARSARVALIAPTKCNSRYCTGSPWNSPDSSRRDATSGRFLSLTS